MKMRSFVLAAAFAGLGTAAAVAQPMAPQNAPAPQQTSCFFVNQFENWKAPDAKTIYIRVNLNKFYRLDLANECPMLLWPDSHLIMNVRGPSTICRAIDWDLKVGQTPPSAGAVPCIVKTMTELSPQEAAAIPRKFKP
jgi:hypothetical protein